MRRDDQLTGSVRELMEREANKKKNKSQDPLREEREQARLDSRSKIAVLLEKMSLVEKVAPKLPLLTQRLEKVEHDHCEFKGLYKNLCLRDDIFLLINSLKGELSTYIDAAIRQWDSEYTRDHNKLVI